MIRLHHALNRSVAVICSLTYAVIIGRSIFPHFTVEALTFFLICQAATVSKSGSDMQSHRLDLIYKYLELSLLLVQELIHLRSDGVSHHVNLISERSGVCKTTPLQIMQRVR